MNMYKFSRFYVHVRLKVTEPFSPFTGSQKAHFDVFRGEFVNLKVRMLARRGRFSWFEYG